MRSRPRLLRTDAEVAKRAAHRAARRHHVAACSCAPGTALFSRCSSRFRSVVPSREQPAGERHRHGRALIAEELARERAHVQHELLDRELSSAFARRSPASATLDHDRRERREVGGRGLRRPRDELRGSFTCAAVSTAPMSAVSGSRPSAAAVTTLSARRPIHCAAALVAEHGPQPPQRAIVPDGPRPNATEPGAARSSRTPGPSPNASSSAIDEVGVHDDLLGEVAR